MIKMDISLEKYTETWYSILNKIAIKWQEIFCFMYETVLQRKNKILLIKTLKSISLTLVALELNCDLLESKLAKTF